MRRRDDWKYDGCCDGPAVSRVVPWHYPPEDDDPAICEDCGEMVEDCMCEDTDEDEGELDR